MRRTDSIRESAQALRCTYIRDNIDAFVEEAALEEYGVAEAIDVLFARELETRRANTIRRNTMAARFPYRMDFASFETGHLSPEVRREVRRLSTLQFAPAWARPRWRWRAATPPAPRGCGSRSSACRTS